MNCICKNFIISSTTAKELATRINKKQYNKNKSICKIIKIKYVFLQIYFIKNTEKI